MRLVRQSVWWVLQGIGSLMALLTWALTARRDLLVLTHFPDVDREGRDRQLGPWIDELDRRGLRYYEVRYVPLNSDTLRSFRWKPSLHLSYAFLVGLAYPGPRKTRLKRRERWARHLLKWLSPKKVVVIDEAGSGQSLVRASKSLGIPSYGIQHGDFQPHNPQYSSDRTSLQAVDTMFCWSEWFARRLTKQARAYDTAQVAITGRLRYPTPAPFSSKQGSPNLRVLLISEPHQEFHQEVEDYLLELRSQPHIDLEIRPHPGEDSRRWAGWTLDEGDLTTALSRCDVVLGVGSSALLEAVYERRPVIVLQTRLWTDPAGYVADGAATSCDSPQRLTAVCDRVRESASPETLEKIRRRIWGPQREERPEVLINELLGIPR